MNRRHALRLAFGISVAARAPPLQAQSPPAGERRVGVLAPSTRAKEDVIGVPNAFGKAQDCALDRFSKGYSLPSTRRRKATGWMVLLAATLSAGTRRQPAVYGVFEAFRFSASTAARIASNNAMRAAISSLVKSAFGAALLTATTKRRAGSMWICWP